MSNKKIRMFEGYADTHPFFQEVADDAVKNLRYDQSSQKAHGFNRGSVSGVHTVQCRGGRVVARRKR